MTEACILHKKPVCTREVIETACLRLLDTVLGLQNVRAEYQEKKTFEPKEKFRVYTVTVSEKVE